MNAPSNRAQKVVLEKFLSVKFVGKANAFFFSLESLKILVSNVKRTISQRSRGVSEKFEHAFYWPNPKLLIGLWHVSQNSGYQWKREAKPRTKIFHAFGHFLFKNDSTYLRKMLWKTSTCKNAKSH